MLISEINSSPFFRPLRASPTPIRRPVVKNALSRIFDLFLMIASSFVTWLALFWLYTQIFSHSRVSHIDIGLLTTITVISVLGHELGHAFFMERYGLRARILLLIVMGGAFTSFEKMSTLSWRKQSTITLAGVCVNALIAMISVLLYFCGVLDSDTTRFIAMINGSMIVWNLIPVGPLDGGRFCKLLFNSIPEDQDLTIARHLKRAALPAFMVLLMFVYVDMMIPMTLTVLGLTKQATHDDPNGSYSPQAMNSGEIKGVSWLYIGLLYSGAAMMLVYDLLKK